jgi:hypothetical protein
MSRRASPSLAECMACGEDKPTSSFVLVAVDTDGTPTGICHACRHAQRERDKRMQAARDRCYRGRDSPQREREIATAYAEEVERKTQDAYARLRQHREDARR